MKEFNSQICTSREQSERLLTLGLKPETADMHYSIDHRGNIRQLWLLAYGDLHEDVQIHSLPAWSLHRLIEMLGEVIQTNGKYLSLPDFGFYEGQNLYDNVINCIEWLIKEGYFNKEYLVNQAEVDEHCKGVLEYLDYIRDEKGKQ